MTNEIILQGPTKDFENIKKITDEGVEYWEARELQVLLDYNEWRNFERVIDKAKIACESAQQSVSDHFVGVNKTIPMPKGAEKEVVDFLLSRYACYLIAQNGDPRKKEIALAQTYFAVQTRKQEITENLEATEKRLFFRDEVSVQNKKLFKTARRAGVSNFGKFNNAGYQGLYGMSLAQVEEFKNIKKGELLDRAGGTELAANWFRITQTEEKLKLDNIQDQNSAEQTHQTVGEKVRETIRSIGGVVPEHLPVEKHIKDMKKEVRKLKKKDVGEVSTG